MRRLLSSLTIATSLALAGSVMAPAIATADSSVPPKRLKLVVKGDTAGQPVPVVVVGVKGKARGYSRALSVSGKKVLKGLPRGTYKVQAPDTSVDGQSVSAKDATKRAVIKSKAGDKVTLRYQARFGAADDDGRPNTGLFLFAGAPNWDVKDTVPADGRTLTLEDDRSAVLYSMLRTRFGGDGISTFGVPKMTGITPILDDPEPQPIRWLMATDGSFPVNNFPATREAGQIAFLASTLPVKATGLTPAPEYPPITGAPVQAFVNNRRGLPPFGSEYCGEVSLFTDKVPANYLPLNGQLKPVRGNEVLYTILGIRYGGNGVTTFQLPKVEQPAGGTWAMAVSDCAFPQRP